MKLLTSRSVDTSPACAKQVILSLLLGAPLFFSSSIFAASCCGGGSASSLVLPKFTRAMLNAAIDYEQYHGFWTQDGTHVSDPPGSDLTQYRINMGYAHRLNDNVQVSVVAPYVWNDNQYSGLTSSTSGLGDMAVSFWYENFDDIKCVYEVNSIKDLVPAAYFGTTLTLPTGISPYDDVSNSFDITGRGFYRLDANMLIDKTIYPWTVALNAAYGIHIERSVNQEYGNYVQPYKKQLGNRRLTSLSLGYGQQLASLDTLSYSIAYADLYEGKGEINGSTDPLTGLAKRSVSFTMAYATFENDWIVKGSWSHSFQQDDWGENFPATDIFSMGVSYVFK